ncbi:MAG TPA: hypothetical protein VJN93_03255 [Candidatus Acidoferrum sp.]|nr:hypothetical protein [Candidatus Acidoferrum sp.]
MADKTKSEALKKTEGEKHKKPYQPPSYRSEHVFEVSALACGKVNATQLTCRTNRKTS